MVDDLSGVKIEPISATDFRLDLSEVTLRDGYYVLTVLTEGISDTEGFSGRDGKSCSWTQFVDGKVAVSVKCLPAEGGTVVPGSGRYGIGTVLTLTATPAEGYEFSHWEIAGREAGSELTVGVTLDSDIECVAVFTLKTFNVTVDCDPVMGHIENAASGIYDYGTHLEMLAVAHPGHSFKQWLVNEAEAGNDLWLAFDVKSDMAVRAEFVQEASAVGDLAGSGVFAVTPVPVRDRMTVSGPFSRIDRLVLCDVSGKAVVQWTDLPAPATVTVPAIAPGFYVVHATTDTGVYTLKVLKQ